MHHQSQKSKSPTKIQPQKSSSRTRPDIILSQNKVRAIMKSSPELEHVGNDALFLVTKAAELFVDQMARSTVENPRGKTSYEYNNLSQVVQREDNLEFLKEIIPLKIPAKQALQEMAKQKALNNSL